MHDKVLLSTIPVVFCCNHSNNINNNENDDGVTNNNSYNNLRKNDVSKIEIFKLPDGFQGIISSLSQNSVRILPQNYSPRILSSAFLYKDAPELVLSYSNYLISSVVSEWSFLLRNKILNHGTSLRIILLH